MEEHRRLLDGSLRHHEMMQSLHLELCSAHTQLNEKDESLSRLELRMAELEGKQAGDQKMGEDLMVDFAQDLRQGEDWLYKVSDKVNGLARLQQQLQKKHQEGAGTGAGAGSGAGAGAAAGRSSRKNVCQQGSQTSADLMTHFHRDASVAPTTLHRSACVGSDHQSTSYSQAQRPVCAPLPPGGALRLPGVGA